VVQVVVVEVEGLVLLLTEVMEETALMAAVAVVAVEHKQVLQAVVVAVAMA
jgi:hypothetical protein